MPYELHPLCTLFPRVHGVEFENLKADIKENGLTHPIVIHEGMILDGGNRYRACVELGIEPKTVPFNGGSIVAFVLSSNLHRRHLTPGQQAAIVASAQDWTQAQGRGGDRKSDQSTRMSFDLSTTEQRAVASGVHPNTQKKADKVARADPELAKQVAHGEVTLPQALKKVEERKRAGGLPTPPKMAASTQERMHREDMSAVFRGCRVLLLALESPRELKDWELEALRHVHQTISNFL